MSNDTRAAKASMDRRALIAKSAAAAGVAWTAPVVIGSFTSPAAAASGCQDCHYAWYASGSSVVSGENLLIPETSATAALPVGMCTGQDDNTPTFVADPVSLGLKAIIAPTGHITHTIGDFSTLPVELTMDAGSSFTIVRVAGLVHRNGAAADCPIDSATGLPVFEAGVSYVVDAPGNDGIPLVVNAQTPHSSGVGWESITVQPNQTVDAICPQTGFFPGILHWGFTDSGGWTGPTSGLVVTLQCID